jgi:hypothetical protein
MNEFTYKKHRCRIKENIGGPILEFLDDMPEPDKADLLEWMESGAIEIPADVAHSYYLNLRRNNPREFRLIKHSPQFTPQYPKGAIV